MPFKPRGTCTLKIFVIRTLKDFAYGEITSTQSRLVLHAALSNSLWHLQFQLPDKIRLIDNLYLRHQLAAVGLLRQDLHEHPEPPTLSSLFSVLALACHGGRINRTNCNHENPLSPLAYAQDLHIYGRAEQTAEHVTGSIILARKMGGLTHIQDPYLIYGVET